MSDEGNVGRNAGIAGAALAVITTAGLAAAKGVAIRDRRRTGTTRKAAVVAAALADPSDAKHHHLIMRDGAKVHVVERGKATNGTVVLLHGVTLSTRLWHYAIDTLGDEFRTIAIDWRGHGRSIAGDLGYGLDILADDLAEVLEQLEVQHAVAVGHSMGGMALMHFCQRHAAMLHHRVNGLMFLSTASADVAVATVPAALTGIIRRTLSLNPIARRAAWTLPGDLGYTMVRVTFGIAPSAMAVEHVRNIVAEMDADATAASVVPLLTHDATKILPKIDVPTMVVVGSADRVTPPVQARKTARLVPGAELTELDGAGHLIMLERRDQFHALVRTLVERSLQAPSAQPLRNVAR